jgi:hypothetical protein
MRHRQAVGARNAPYYPSPGTRSSPPLCTVRPSGLWWVGRDEQPKAIGGPLVLYPQRVVVLNHWNNGLARAGCGRVPQHLSRSGLVRYNADEVALRHALGDVGPTIVRIPGER